MSGINSGKEAAMISRNSTQEILLNMFDRSKKTAARVGGSPCCSLLLIYFSIANWMALMMVALPLGIPTAKL